MDRSRGRGGGRLARHVIRLLGRRTPLGQVGRSASEHLDQGSRRKVGAPGGELRHKREYRRAGRSRRGGLRARSKKVAQIRHTPPQVCRHGEAMPRSAHLGRLHLCNRARSTCRWACAQIVQEREAEGSCTRAELWRAGTKLDPRGRVASGARTRREAIAVARSDHDTASRTGNGAQRGLDRPQRRCGSRALPGVGTARKRMSPPGSRRTGSPVCERGGRRGSPSARQGRSARGQPRFAEVARVTRGRRCSSPSRPPAEAGRDRPRRRGHPMGGHGHSPGVRCGRAAQLAAPWHDGGLSRT